MAFVPKPTFPNVPNLPGVPQLRRSSSVLLSAAPALSAAAAVGALWRGLFAKNVWGIFNQPKAPPATGEVVTDADGNRTLVISSSVPAAPTLVVEADSVLDFGYRNEVDIPDFPIQNGSFANYNRVNLPYEASVRLSKGGSVEDRTTFINQIKALMGTTDLYQIITPEQVYTDVSLMRFEVIRRGASGAYFLSEVDLYFREIRTVTQVYSQSSVTVLDAKDASAAPVVNQGTVNGEQPAQTPAISGVVTE